MVQCRAFVGLSDINVGTFATMCSSFRPQRRLLHPVEVTLLRASEFHTYACNVLRPATNWFMFPEWIPATMKLVVEVLAFNNFVELTLEFPNAPNVTDVHSANVHLIASIISGSNMGMAVMVPLNLEKSHYNHVYPLPHEQASQQRHLQLLQQHAQLQRMHADLQGLLVQHQNQVLVMQQQMLSVARTLMMPYADPYAPAAAPAPAAPPSTPVRRRSEGHAAVAIPVRARLAVPDAPRQELADDRDADAAWVGAAEAVGGEDDIFLSEDEDQQQREREREDVAANAIEMEHRLEARLGPHALRARKRLSDRPPSLVLELYRTDDALAALERELMEKYARSFKGCNKVWDILGPGAFSIFADNRADPVFRLKKANEYVVQQLAEHSTIGCVLSTMDPRKAGDPVSLEQEFRESMAPYSNMESMACDDTAYKILTGRQVALNVCGAVQRKRGGADVVCDTCFICQESLEVALYTTLTVCGHGVHVCCWLDALSNEIAQNQHPEHAPTLAHMNLNGRDISASPRLPFLACPVCRSVVVGVNVTDLVLDDERHTLPLALPDEVDANVKVSAYRYLKKKQLARQQEERVRNRLTVYLKAKKEAYEREIEDKVWNHTQSRWMYASEGCRCHPELCPAKSAEAAAAAGVVARMEGRRRRRGPSAAPAAAVRRRRDPSVHEEDQENAGDVNNVQQQRA